MKITRYWPYGPHGTVGNLLTDISEIWEHLNSLGVPCFYKGADGYGPLFELFRIGDKHGVENVGVWRSTKFDVPNWFAPTPKHAAEEHAQKILTVLPPEFDKRVWLEIINEPDKDEDTNFPDWGSEEFSNWLGQFMVEVAKILLPMGFKVLGFGFSSGEPELGDWEVSGMIEFLELCEENPETLGVALHEYSYKESTFLGTDPWLIGRFTKLFAVCDKFGIKRPKVAITEFGATLWKLPNPDIGVEELLKLADELYALNPEILGVAIWNFGQGWQDIRNIAVNYLKPMFQVAKDYRLVVEVDEDEEEDDEGEDVAETFEQRLWKYSIKRQIEHGIQLAPTAIQDAIRKDGFHPVSDEAYTDEFPPFMAAEDWQYRTRKRRVYYWHNGKVHWFNDPGTGVIDPPPSGSGIDLAPYFLPPQDYGTLFELRRSDGSQERIQHQKQGNQLFITKGTGGLEGKSEFEHLMVDGSFIYRGVDTSPGGSEFYHQYEVGSTWAKWVKRFMKVGETYVGTGHKVEFFKKGSCSWINDHPNRGEATNIIKLAALHTKFSVNGLTIPDVIELHGSNGEAWFFAKNLGMVGWYSPWNPNGNYVAEIHPPGSRPNNQKESLCSYTLP